MHANMVMKPQDTLLFFNTPVY